jgi:ribosomal protein L15
MGEVGRKFLIKSVAVSASARAKIEQAGGTIEA